MPIVADFGNSVATNIAAQVVNPLPHAVGPAPTTDGKRIGDAIERYRTGKVYPPVPPIEAVVKEGSAADQPGFPASAGSMGQ
jgi:type IV pilus biogenesis protein CpaD/CtpE